MEHFTAIKVIERLAPEINSSQDPKGTLIKFAKDNNLSPAELERLGQVFNSAKTLSHLEKSANRGDSYELLDVEDLVSAFTAHDTPTVIEKKASSGIKFGGALPNLFTVETLEKQASNVELHPVAEAIFRNQREKEATELKGFVSDIPATIHDLKTEVVKMANNIVRDLYLSNKDAKAVFTKLAEDSQASVDQNKDALEFLCKKAFTYFGDVKIDFEKVASRKVVTDTTGLLTKVEEMQDMINVMYDLDGILKKADMFNRIRTPEEQAEMENIEVGNKVEADLSGEPQTDTTIDPPINPPTSNVNDSVLEYLMSKQKEELPKQSPPADLKALDNIKSFVDNLYANKVKELYNVKPTERGYVNAGVDKAISSIETAAVIQELMQDPIISAHTPSSVVSIYNSLAQVNPSMMRDKNVAKFALREALQYEGVTPHTYGQMMEIDKDKSDIAKNELQIRKDIYGKI